MKLEDAILKYLYEREKEIVKKYSEILEKEKITTRTIEKRKYHEGKIDMIDELRNYINNSKEWCENAKSNKS